MAEQSGEGWQSHLRAYAYTSLFCLGIASVFWFVSDDVSFWDSMIVSFCIGWSINTAFTVLENGMNRFMSPYVSPIPITAVGLAVGLVLAGLLIVGRPWFFFTDSYLTLVFGVFFGIIGFFLFSTRGRLLEARAALAQAEAEQERQQKLLTQTELRLLQAQIEPHFLFNTLTNIAALIRTDPDAAESMLSHLTTLLRSSLDRTRTLETTLRDELDIVRAYLSIQETRMHGRLRYKVDHAAALDDLKLPPLIVQPLVENAVKYAIDPREEGGTIYIQTRQTSDAVEIEVADDGPGIDANGAEPGTGIRNVKQRLSALLDGAQLKLQENEQGGLRAVISIPLATPDGPSA